MALDEMCRTYAPSAPAASSVTRQPSTFTERYSASSARVTGTSAALSTTTSHPRAARATATASRTSARTNSCAPGCSGGFTSSVRTSCPAAASAFARWAPRKPVPPVTSARTLGEGADQPGADAPQDDAHLEWAVLPDDDGGVVWQPRAVVDQVEHPEHAVHHERHGQEHRLRTRGEHRIERVGDDDRRGHDRDQLVHEGHRVLLEHGPLRVGAASHRHHLSAPLAEAEEEREQAGAQQEPFG